MKKKKKRKRIKTNAANMYRGNSLIRNTHPPRIAIGPQA